MDKKVYQALLKTFSGELESCHQDLVANLLLLEKAEAQALTTHLEALFRTAHNIKGAAKSVSLGAIADIAHQLEDEFSLLCITVMSNRNYCHVEHFAISCLQAA